MKTALGNGEERGGRDGRLVSLTVDPALGEMSRNQQRIRQPGWRVPRGGRLEELLLVASGCRMLAVPSWVFLSQGHVGDVLGHYSWGLFRGRSGVRFPVKLVFR